MTQITVFSDPGNISGREVYHTLPGETLADWILDWYGPEGFPTPTAVFRGGISKENQLDLTHFDDFDQVVEEPVFIVHCPLGFDPITIGIILTVAVVSAVAVAVLVPLPDVADVSGSGGRQARRSPNNALSAPTNIVRTLDRAPDVFGRVTSFPDIIAPAVVQYIDHIKYQLEYLCVGHGYHDLVEFRSGDTPIDQIPGSSVAIYNPGEAPAEILKTRESNEVAGQELKGPNDRPLTVLTTSDTITYKQAADRGVISAPSGAWEGFEIGDQALLFQIAVTVSSTPYNLDGTYAITQPPTNTDLSIESVSTVNANWTNLVDSTAYPVNSASPPPQVTQPSAPQPVGPFIIPGADRNDQVWLDFTAPRGLAQGDNLNKTKTVQLTALFEEVDDVGTPTGPSFSYPITLSDNTRDPRFWTFKVTETNGLQLNTRYRVQVERITDSAPSSTVTVVEEIRWQRLVGIEDISAPDTSKTTRVQIETKATEQVAALQERRFNVQATRKTVTWDGAQVIGNIETGEGLTASRRFADALLHYLLDPDLGALTIDRLDVQQLYDIQNELDASAYPEKGEFSGTFDGANTPALEEMRQIAVAARCFLYREGGIFGVTRDQEQPVSRALFTRRNKRPESEARTIRLNRPLDPNGIKLEYRDIIDDNPRTITLPDDLPSDDPLFGLSNATNPITIEASGIRQWAQAWDRAQYEFRRQVYGRESVSTTVTDDGLLVPLNARVRHVDGTRLTTDLSDGEIVGIDGLTLTTSEPCIFAGIETYSVVLRDVYGNPGAPIGCTKRTDTVFGFVLEQAPPFPIRTRDAQGQRGTLYSLGPDGSESAELYLLQRKTPEDGGYVTLELINYASEYYGADNTNPPDRPEV